MSTKSPAQQAAEGCLLLIIGIAMIGLAVGGAILVLLIITS